jgi:hypothetical protein
VRSGGVGFDKAFVVGEGSDTLFVRRFVAAAGPPVWCDEVLVAVARALLGVSQTHCWRLRRRGRSLLMPVGVAHSAISA